MSGLIPFAECIARPKDNGRENWLTDHLLAARDAIENRLKKCSFLLTNYPLCILLAGLAGVCHDLAKSHVRWQAYIRGKLDRGPNHAPEGAFFFSYLAYHLLQAENRWPEYAGIWLWLTRDIADHHGSLKHLGDEYWMAAGQWDKMDLPGMTAFLRQVYSKVQLQDLTAAVLKQWAKELYHIQKDAADVLDAGYSAPTLELMRQLSFWREMTTALIAGDRFHVAPTDDGGFHKADYEKHDQLLDDFSRAAVDDAMAAVRNDAQQEIVRQMANDPLRRVYTLEMPTGYGKTITALRLATWLGKEQGYEKIIYVAPYLSILEQTSNVIENVLHEYVLEHHSLATLSGGKQNDGAERAAEEADEEGQLHSGQLIMEAWASPVVCTSFQQWSKALFPGRAQDTLRRAFLHNSVVIIDEPQIFAPESWNVFLCGLEAVAELYNLRIIFLSATMPPFTYGLSAANLPGRLVVNQVKKVERYQVKREAEMDEQAVADFLTGYLPDKKDLSQAAILNTITDAYLVYQKLAVKVETSGLKLLHGMMIPLHKRVEIEKIKQFHKQKSTKEQRLYVVSTQIIEAGVDLSFNHIMRALPVLPSIVQAAGRVNRNFSGDLGLLTLMLFLRHGEKNTRGAIYPRILQKFTDELLREKDIWLESELLELIKRYYKIMFTHNSYEAGKQDIIDAYEGNWPKLGQFKAFGEDYFKLPVFVPWQTKEDDKPYFPARFTELQQRLQLTSPERIYELYGDRGHYSGMSFQERKEFMILMHHYVVNVPAELAFSLVGKEPYLTNRIPCLLNKSDYDPIAGLAKRNVEGFDPFI